MELSSQTSSTVTYGGSGRMTKGMEYKCNRCRKSDLSTKLPPVFSTEQFGGRYQAILSPINIGTLCCFKYNGYIYFGHLAGRVVDDFEQMSFTYVLKCDDRYFFSKECIEKPPHVHTAHEAEEYWNTLSNQESED